MTDFVPEFYVAREKVTLEDGRTFKKLQRVYVGDERGHDFANDKRFYAARDNKALSRKMGKILLPRI